MDNSRYRTEEPLQPEHYRALNYLELNLTSYYENRISSVKLSDLENSNIFFFTEPFSAKDIPSSKEWRWNQTKGKKKVLLPLKNTTIYISKLIPRRRNPKTKTSTDKLPSLKLWSFIIEYNSTTLYSIWCENGRYKKSIVLPAKQTTNIPLNINDYSFLAEFMDPKVAAELWPL